MSVTVLPKKGKATELTYKVAETLVRIRLALKKSQREFAEMLDVSFQQYQKYEKGRDRLSLEKAVMLCKKLSLSLNIFEDDSVKGFAESEQAPYGTVTEMALTIEEQELLNLFRTAPEQQRKNMLETLRRLGKIPSSPDD